MNISRWNPLLAALAIVVVVSASAASPALASVATSVPVDDAYFSGSRTTVGTTGSGGGLKWNPAAGNWSQGKFSISWIITDNGSDFTYEYTVKTPGALGGTGAQLSHWILEISPFDADGNSLKSYWEDVFITPPTPGDYTATGLDPVAAGDVGLTGSGSGNPGMPNVNDPNDNKDDIFGVRFSTPTDETKKLNTVVVTFTTPEVPVWGDFYAKDGGGSGTNAVWAYNAGFGTDPTKQTKDFTNWIPRPDGQQNGGQAPEPATLIVWSLLIGSVGLAGLRRRSRNRA
jgi:hypothetical protein